MAPTLAVIFRHLVNGDSFSACWRLTEVVHISINLFLSTVFSKTVTGKLSLILESSSLLPLSRFRIREVRTWGVLLILPHHLQVALNRGL